MLAVGTQHQVDRQLLEGGNEPIYVGGYRVSALLFSTHLSHLTRSAYRFLHLNQLNELEGMPWSTKHLCQYRKAYRPSGQAHI